MIFSLILLFITIYLFVRIGNIYCWHIKASLVEAWSLAQLLNNLHHHSLSVRLVPSFVSLAQVEPHPLRVLGRDLLNNVQSSLAQSLTHQSLTHDQPIRSRDLPDQ